MEYKLCRIGGQRVQWEGKIWLVEQKRKRLGGGGVPHTKLALWIQTESVWEVFYCILSKNSTLNSPFVIWTLQMLDQMLEEAAAKKFASSLFSGNEIKQNWLFLEVFLYNMINNFIWQYGLWFVLEATSPSFKFFSFLFLLTLECI